MCIDTTLGVFRGTIVILMTDQAGSLVDLTTQRLKLAVMTGKTHG